MCEVTSAAWANTVLNRQKIKSFNYFSFLVIITEWQNIFVWIIALLIYAVSSFSSFSHPDIPIPQ